MQETNPPARDAENRPAAPFDLHGRCRLVAGVLERLRDGDETLRVLGIGADAALLPAFLPTDEVVAAGAETPGPSHEDGAFDYVVSLDALRGTEMGDSGVRLSELRRVSRRGVLVSSPFDSGAVRAAERAAGDFRRSLRPEEAEPEARGTTGTLPDLDGVRRFFEGQGDAVTVLPSGYLPHWLALTCLASYGLGPGGALDGIGDFYDEAISASDGAEPSYRHLIVSLKEPSGADLGGLSSAGAEPASRGADLFGALAAVLPLTAEVQRLNARLARRDGDLARKEAQIEDLSHRLAARMTVDETRFDQQVNALRRNRDSIKRDNNGVRRQLAESRQQVAESRQQVAEITTSKGWRLLTLQRRVRIKIGQLLRSR